MKNLNIKLQKTKVKLDKRKENYHFSSKSMKFNYLLEFLGFINNSNFILQVLIIKLIKL